MAVIIDWTFEIHVQRHSTREDLTCCVTSVYCLPFSILHPLPHSLLCALSVKGQKLLQVDYEIL